MYSAYLGCSFDLDDRKKMLVDADKFFQRKLRYIDAFLGRGVSGITLASIFSERYQKDLMVSRKDTENTHGYHCVEGYSRDIDYCFVDDFIASGNTLRQAISSVHDAGDANCVGVFFANTREGYGKSRVKQFLRKKRANYDG